MTTRLLAFTLACAAVLWAQKPVVYEGGVVNAATFGVAGEPANAVAPGSIASVFGENLATTTAAADELPLPTELAGTSVTIAGLPAPLFFVSPGQINLQVPIKAHSCTAVPGSEPIVVTTPSGASEPIDVDLARQVFGIFTLDFGGCGQGAILNAASDGSVSINGPSNAVSPGDFISIFATGLGCLTRFPESTLFPTPPDGQPAPPDARANPNFQPSLFVDRGRAEKTFVGRAPGLVGVDQYNIRIPEDAREGCRTPLEIET